MKKFEQLLSLAWRMQHLLQENDLDSGEFGDELVAIQQAAQQSVQPTGGTLPDFRALFDPEVLSGLEAKSTPPTIG